MLTSQPGRSSYWQAALRSCHRRSFAFLRMLLRGGVHGNETCHRSGECRVRREGKMVCHVYPVCARGYLYEAKHKTSKTAIGTARTCRLSRRCAWHGAPVGSAAGGVLSSLPIHSCLPYSATQEAVGVSCSLYATTAADVRRTNVTRLLLAVAAALALVIQPPIRVQRRLTHSSPLLAASVLARRRLEPALEAVSMRSL